MGPWSRRRLEAALESAGFTVTIRRTWFSAGPALYLVGIGLLGIGLGALLRRTAGAIATLVGLILVLPILAQALPSPWNTNVAKLLPDGAGQAILQVHHTTDSLSPGIGFALFCGYIAAILAAAFITLARRDA